MARKYVLACTNNGFTAYVKKGTLKFDHKGANLNVHFTADPLQALQFENREQAQTLANSIDPFSERTHLPQLLITKSRALGAQYGKG